MADALRKNHTTPRRGTGLPEPRAGGGAADESVADSNNQIGDPPASRGLIPPWLARWAKRFGDRLDLTPPAEPSGQYSLYERSYLVIRLAVGAIGIGLPVVLIIGEAFVFGGITARGSISAYYHSPMQNTFVGALCIVAYLLLTYLSGLPRTLDFWLSALSGAALFVLIFFPTKRPDFLADEPRCERTPGPIADGCSATEFVFGEATSAVFHMIAAAVFIVSLALISLAFAARSDREGLSPLRIRTHLWSAYAIFAAIGIVLMGLIPPVHDLIALSGLKPLYIGEVAAVLAFGISWFIAGHPERLPGAVRRAVGRSDSSTKDSGSIPVSAPPAK